ncbi:trypsin-like [Chrysoperla carnea]|uniref:trypsin-like n=1 Tax=Chrysoperla carnea TaxID=189513 RepID=UPI001D091553|nr:trypsin-like [Chrysoperla carnea]
MFIWQDRYFVFLLFVIREFNYIIGGVIVQVYSYRDSGVLRILGGEYTTIEENPFVVQVEFDGVQVCGGSILTETIILTAAHCSIVQRTYFVRAGTTFREKGGIIIPVKEIVVHHLFDRSKHTTFDFDVALLKLANPLPFSDRIQIIELATELDRIIANNFGFAIGWGKSKLNENILQHVKLPILPQDQCFHTYSQDPYHSKFHNITDRMFCASYLDTQGRDTCQGDSGGPFIVNYKLYGIVSWGDKCGEPSLPGVYVRLTDWDIREWIFINVEKLMESN